MKKNYKNQKGISLLSLSIAIIVLLVIVGTVLFNVRSNLGLQRVKSMQADIENLRGKVANYYLQYGSLPILNRYEGNIKRETKIDSSVISDVVENASNNLLDTGDYYIIDLKAMDNITLTYGEDYEKLKDETVENIQNLKNGTLTDVYIINSVSHNIFYAPGITYDGKTYYTQYQDEEKEKIGESNFDIDLESRVEKDSKGNINYRIDKGERAPGNRNAIYIDEDENKAVIPAGFTVSGEQGESTIENGLVVRDDNQNEWVWIPVSDTDLNKMYENGEYALSKTNIKTNKISITNTLGNRVLNRGVPGSENGEYKEPDVLSDSANDLNDENRIAAGFIEKDGTTASSYEIMALELANDYNNMLNSVRINGGFYVGRYELSGNIISPEIKKNKDVITGFNWYNLYRACKNFKFQNDKIKSRMIWGCQWDQICRFINLFGDKKDIDDSRSYGNYSDSLGFNDTSEFGKKQKTGYSEKWKANNIYDIAGNCWEWTQESFYNQSRAFRGRILFI